MEAKVKEGKLNSCVSVTGKSGEGKPCMEKHAVLLDRVVSGPIPTLIDFTGEYEHILEEDQDEQAEEAEKEGDVDGQALV